MTHLVVLRVIFFLLFQRSFRYFYSRTQFQYFAVVLGFQGVNIATAQFDAVTISGANAEVLLNGEFDINGGNCFDLMKIFI